MRQRSTAALLAASCLLLAALTGCESVQRKFTRKPKSPRARPTPVINFQDYSQAMTPLDRYRKHCLIFDYWNGDLIEALQANPVNPKRFKRASSESLTELEAMKDLVTDDVAARFMPLIEERTELNQQLQSGAFTPGQANTFARVLESQTRQVHREFFWRDVQDQLKPQEARGVATPQGAEGNAPTP